MLRVVGGAHHEVETVRGLGWCSRERKGEISGEKGKFPLVNVVCLNENWRKMKTEHHRHRTAGISAVDLDQR